MISMEKFVEAKRGDRVVMPCAGGRWLQFRHVPGRGATSEKIHDSRGAAIRQARWLALRENVSVFLLERENGESRLRRL